MRIGTGYDVHRLKEGRKLILGGVEIPHSMGLEGHSDADVAVHAVMDALLGAAALGDIGKHFPDTDDTYKGISSLKLLAHVGELLRQEGYVVENIDVTIIAQKPKLRPFIEEMEQNVAHTLRIAQNQINIKATTEERLGFTGREEGISAQAVCMLAGLYESSLPMYDSGRACDGCGGCRRQTEVPEDSGPFVDYYYQWKTADNRILVMEEEGRIQVMIHLNPYDFQICGSGWQIPYIVAVATRPDCRRQGKMGRVMERLLQDLEQQDCPFTILLPADPAYYEGQGFVFFPRQNEWEIPPVVPDLKAAELEWRQAKEADIPELEWRQAKEADIPELVRLSNDILQKKSQIFAVRDRAYYQRLLEETRVEHGGVLLLTSEEKICGILVYGLEAEEKPAVEIKELLLKLPSGEQAAEFLCQKALPDCEISFSRPRMMFRVASLEAFVSMLKSENPRSFTVKVRDSAVKANCGYFQITLNREGGRLERITDSCRKIPEFHCRPDTVSSGRQEPVSEKIQEMDISRLAVELLQDISLDFREWV